MIDSPILEISLLGPVEIHLNGQPITIKRKIERALLYILAGKHTIVSRTTLIDMIWPSEESIDTRAALRTALSRLRRALPDPDFLLTEMDQVRLDINRCRVDLHLFTNAYQSLKNLLSVYKENHPLPTQIKHQIEEALDLWHGDTFLMGDDLSKYPAIYQWQESINRKLTKQRRFLKRRLAAHYYAAGQLDSALMLYIELSREEIADVSFHLTVLDILTKLGRLQVAIDYCDSLEVRYEQTYNAPLPDELLKRCEYTKILFGNSQSQAQNEWPIQLTMNLSFIGRQSELTCLRQMYFRGGLVEIKGEMGCGKTRLVQELYQTLRPQPMLLFAPSYERENTLPLAPIVHCLRHSVPKNFWSKLKPIYASQISILLPELSEGVNNNEQVTNQQVPTGKQYLFDALLNTFIQISKTYGRILFFLDDAQWADTQTLQVLDYFFNHKYFDKHGLLIIAARTEESNNALENMLDNLYRTSTVEILSINGLNPRELRDLAQQAINDSPPPSFIDQLYRETNGNPFIALEIIRNLLDTQTDLNLFSPEKSLPLPVSVRALIRRRLNRLDENTQYLLQCAAVLGDYFSYNLLKAIANLKKLSDSGLVNALIDSGFIQQAERENRKILDFHFKHEKLRQVILKETPPALLKILHLRVAKVLENIPEASTKSAITAGHYLAGGDIVNAFSCYIEAAQYAWSLGANDEVTHAYKSAELLINNASKQVFSKQDAVRLYKSWSNFAYESYQYALAEDTALKLLSIGEKEGDPQIKGLSQIILSEACFLRYEFDIGLKFLNKAYENLSLVDDKYGMIQVCIRQSVLYWWKIQFEESLKAAKQALAYIKTFRSNKNPELQRLNLNAERLLSMNYYSKGEAKKSLDIAKHIKQKYTENLSPSDKIRIFYTLGFAHLISANFDQSIHNLEKSLDLSTALNRPLIMEVSLYTIAKAELICGMLDKAYEHAIKAKKMGEEFNDIHAIVSANMILGCIFRILQNNERAKQYFRVAQLRDSFSTTSLYGLENNIELAIALSKTGGFSEARLLIQTIINKTRESGIWTHYIKASLIDQYFNLQHSSLDEVNEKIASSIQLAEDKELPYQLFWGQLIRANLNIIQGSYHPAATEIKELIRKSQVLKAPLITLAAVRLAARIRQNNADHVNDIDIERIFDDLMRYLEDNTQSEPLKTELGKAKAIWRKEISPP